MRRRTLALTVLLAGLTAASAAGLEAIFLVRHAEKVEEWPLELDEYWPLDERGERRADELAAALAGEDVAAVYASPTQRTVATAMPLARAQGVGVRVDEATIDPERQAAFLEVLRETHAEDRAVVVVGHSNTVPQLLARLGVTEDCHEELGIHHHGDERLLEGHEDLYRVDPAVPGCDGVERRRLLLPEDEEDDAPPAPLRVVLDPAQLVAGERVYGLRYASESMGKAVYALEREEGEIVLRQETEIPQAKIRRQNVIRLDAATHAPRELRITGPMGPSPADVALAWEGDRVSGRSAFPRARAKPQGELAVDRELPAGALPKSAVFSLLPAMPIDRVSAFAFNWYEAEDDVVKRVDVRVGGPEELTVPAGTFEAYRVELAGVEPAYVLWVTTEAPRRVVRIELVDQPWSYELVR